MRRNYSYGPLLLVTCLFALVSATNVRGEEPNNKPVVPPREIFVPFDDLPILLEGADERIFLDRDAYEALLREAKVGKETRAPLDAVVKSARYEGKLASGRALISGELEIETLGSGVHLVPLPLANLAVRSVRVNDEPAYLARDERLGLVLPLRYAGEHRVSLELTTLVAQGAAQQSLNATLPFAPSARLSLQVPGNVDVKSGGVLVDRVYRDDDNSTQLELLMPKGPLALVLTLNNKQHSADRVVIARGVLVDEITAAYERVHATVSLIVLHGAMEQVAIDIPAGFEVTSVDSPLVSRWRMNEGQLEVTLREAATSDFTLQIIATRHAPPTDGWRFPRFTPRDVASQAFVLGILLEDRWQASDLEPRGLLPIDTRTITSALPPSLFAASPGLPAIRPIAAYYAPHDLFELSAKFSLPEPKLRVKTTLLLTASAPQLTADLGITLLPTGEPLHSFDIHVPAPWNVSRITAADGRELKLQRFEDVDSVRLHVGLTRSVPAEQSLQIQLLARAVPDRWLVADDKIEFKLPQIRVSSAQHIEGAVAIATDDEFRVLPQELVDLVSLTETERREFGLAGRPGTLAYRFEGSTPFASFVRLDRTPITTAQVYSFHRIEPGLLKTHEELVYDVRGASVETLQFTLQASTPPEISIRALGDATVREFSSVVKEDKRTWRVTLAERRQGLVRLAIDWERRLPGDEVKRLSLSCAEPQGVTFFNGFVAIEGHAELELQVTEHPRRVDEGELYAAEYQVGSRLVGAYSYLGPTKLEVDVRRPAGHELPSALVQRASLKTLLSVAGRHQTEASFALVTKAPFLEIALPTDASLWTISLGGTPTKPQRQGDHLLLSLPATADTQDVRIVYEQQKQPLTWRSTLQLAPPRLFIPSGDEPNPPEISLAEAQWSFTLPPQYELRGGDGSLSSPVVAHRPAAMKLWRWLRRMGGDGSLWSFHSFILSERADALSYSSAAPETAAAPQVMSPAAKPYITLDADDAKPESMPEEAAAKEAEEAKKSVGEPAATAPQPAADVDALALNGEMVDSSNTTAPRDRLAMAPQTKATTATGKLEGVAGLVIDLQQPSCDAGVLFTGLTDRPNVELVLVDRARSRFAGWAIGLAVFACGMACWHLPSSTRWRLVILSLLIATFLPLLWPPLNEVSDAFDGLFFGAAFTLFAYVIGAWWLSVASLMTSVGREMLPLVRFSSRFSGIVILCSLMAATAEAQAPAVDVVDQSPPVKLPPDAVIVPYDWEQFGNWDQIEKVLVPLARYQELQKLALPAKPLQLDKLPVRFALGAASYSATLSGDITLDVIGELPVVSYVEGPTSIPLALAGGTLLEAKLGDNPARLRVVAPQVEKAEAKNRPAPQPLLLLDLPSGGKHKLTFRYRFVGARQGGWIRLRGTLPAAGGAKWTITPPDEPTEIRLSGTLDVTTSETKNARDVLTTALDFGGQFSLSWRSQIAEAMIDRGLSATTQGVFDVRRDVVRAIWKVDLAFPRSRRERFLFQVPADFAVERIEGANVRSWKSTAAGGPRQIEVVLLHEASDKETLTVSAARYGTVGLGEMERFRVPLLTTIGAELQQGSLVIRRDATLSVRADEAEGLIREDAMPSDELLSAANGYDASLLPLKTYQAYRYSSLPAKMFLAASPEQISTRAEARLIFNASERATAVEGNFVITPQELPALRVDIKLPLEIAELEVETSLSCAWEKSVVRREGYRLLTILPREEQTSPFSVLLTGKLAASDKAGLIELRKFEVLNVAEQEGTAVWATDPAYDLTVQSIQGAEVIPLQETFSWLVPEKRANARLAMRWSSSDYSATLRTTARTPRIGSRLLHNIKLTRRSLEQTTLVEFQVTNAGVRRLSLWLPTQLQDAQVTALNTRSIDIIPPTKSRPDFAELRIELEDEFLGKYQVLLSHDQLLPAQATRLVLPRLADGITGTRLVMIENTSRDEVVVDQSEGLESLVRGQQAYQELAAALSAEPTLAYQATANDATAAITLSLKQRAAVDTAAARIGLAETTFVLDKSGAYRARQVYRVDNSSEQHLEVELPLNSKLWTTLVDGSPAKPAQGTKQSVRIPLLRRARGDADYEVALLYSGELPTLGISGKLSLPFARAVNIRPERSAVKVLLPETHAWYSFDGSLGSPVEEADVLLTTNQYINQQLRISSEVLKSGDSFAVIRAQSSIRRLQADLQQSNAANSAAYATDSELQQQYEFNARQLDDSLKTANEQLERSTNEELTDNRARLGKLFQNDLSRSKNVVGNDTRNFQVETAPGKQTPADGPGRKASQVNEQWFQSNKLKDAKGEPAKPASRVVEQPGAIAAAQSRGGRQQFQQKAAQPTGDNGRGLQQELATNEADGRNQALQRYRSKLENSGFAGPAVNQPAPPTTPPPTNFPTTSAAAGFGRASGMGMAGRPAAAGGAFGAGERGTIDPNVTKGLASLQIDLPRRGREYRFVTARGDLEISARYVRGDLLEGLRRVLIAVVVVALIGLIARFTCGLASKNPLSLCLLVALLAVVGMALGILPRISLLVFLSATTLFLLRLAVVYLDRSALRASRHD